MTTTTTTTTTDLATYFDRMATRSAEVLDNTRKALAGRAATGSLNDVACASNDMAKAWGAADAWAGALNVVRYGEREGLEVDAVAAEVRAFVVAKLTEGADDTWSGRTNDVSRSRHDGAREALRRIAGDVDFASVGR